MGGSAQASSIVTVEEPVRTISPSIIAIGTPAVSEATLSDTSTAIVAEGKIELTPLDPLNMLPAKADGAARMEELTPSIVAITAPDPDISNEIVAAIEERKPTRDPMPMVMRGGIVGDPFMLPEIELSKDIHKMPAKASGDQTTQLPVPADPNALSKPQVTETGAPMPADGMSAGGRPRR